MKKVLTKIIWLVDENRIPPIINKEYRPIHMGYHPIIIFDNQLQDENYYSSIIFNNSINGKESIAEVAYLVDSAPVENLKIGKTFSLYEGNRKVAIGEVIEEI